MHSLPSSIALRISLTALRSVRGPWRNRQLRPKISSRVYPVKSRNPSEAKTMGLSGSEGSAMTKDCWMRSRVVAMSSPPLLAATAPGASRSTPSPVSTAFSTSSTRLKF